MDPQQGAYDASGRLVCKTCASTATVAEANRTIEERDPGSTRNLYLGSAGAALIGIASCCLSSVGMVAIVAAPMAMISGGWTIQHLLRNSDVKTQLGGGYWIVLFLSIVGVLFAFLALAVAVLSIIGVGMSRI